jgi:hypothetical protein
MSVREKDDPVLFQRIQEQNLLRQYDLLSNCVEIGLRKGIEAFDKYTLGPSIMLPFPISRSLVDGFAKNPFT